MLMIGKELTAQQRLHKAVVDIMAHDTHMAVGPVLMIGDKKIDANTSTAYTDGVNEVYGEKFISTLTDAQLRFLILHESYHKLYQHLTTWQHLNDRNPNLANMACDYVINIKLVDADMGKGFISMPIGGLCDERFRGMDSAQVFNILSQGKEGNAGSSAQGSPMDEHDWEQAKSMGDTEKKAIQRELDSALRQGKILAGKCGSSGDRGLDELLTPQVDWREQLREFVQTSCTGNDYSTWRRPNRRYLGTGHYMPSGISESIGELVVAVDTSGSVGQRALTLFLSELASICEVAKPSKLRMIYWGTKVVREEVYEEGDIGNVVMSTKPEGGGGTDVECVPTWLQANQVKAQAVVVLTDGYLSGTWGQWSTPVLWGILGNPYTTAPVGKTVHIKN